MGTVVESWRLLPRNKFSLHLPIKTEFAFQIGSVHLLPSHSLCPPQRVKPCTLQRADRGQVCETTRPGGTQQEQADRRCHCLCVKTVLKTEWE